MRRHRPTIPRRTPIFLGCEGESEQAYGQFINELARAKGLHVHLEVVNLSPGAGDPLSRMRRAQQEIESRQRKRVEFVSRAVLLDSDQVANDQQRRELVDAAGRGAGIDIIWQTPCHEALLLRHFGGFEQRRPATSAEALQALRRVWPEYEKAMTRAQLARKLGIEDLLRASRSEPALLAFLRRIGLVSEGH
jgi:hypothetical protein